MAKHVIHISELEGAHHFAILLAKLRAGEEIIIEDDSRPWLWSIPLSRYAEQSQNR